MPGISPMLKQRRDGTFKKWGGEIWMCKIKGNCYHATTLVAHHSHHCRYCHPPLPLLSNPGRNSSEILRTLSPHCPYPRTRIQTHHILYGSWLQTWGDYRLHESFAEKKSDRAAGEKALARLVVDWKQAFSNFLSQASSNIGFFAELWEKIYELSGWKGNLQNPLCKIHLNTFHQHPPPPLRMTEHTGAALRDVIREGDLLAWLHPALRLLPAGVHLTTNQIATVHIFSV